MITKTLKEQGTPWAETYRGSGRLTGRLTEQPIYMDTGDIAPGWQWVGDMTSQEFDERFQWQEHDHCHANPQDGCPYCDIMTAGEIVRRYRLSASTVRAAIHRGLPARKSGGVWLITRHVAEARWGNRAK